MIFEINSNPNNFEDKTGNKAKNILKLKQEKYNVPNGIILNFDVYDEILIFNNQKENINNIINSISQNNISDVSCEINQLFNKMIIPAKLLSNILTKLDDNKLYAVRSSCSNEDLEDASFAGQYDTYLNVKKDLIETKILDCYASMFHTNVLQYMYDNKININTSKMAIIIQEMIPAEYSGVIFTINPNSGNDKEMIIDLSTGLGENVVDGKVKSHSYRYNWYNNRLINYDNWIDKNILDEIIQTSLKIQLYFGMPYDIEIAYYDSKLYILQARPITKIMYNGIREVWSTANFKDTISANVSTPFMWSMYEYAFNRSLRNFIIESRLLKPEEVTNLFCTMFYCRGYWNTTAVKKAMSQFPMLNEELVNTAYGVSTVGNKNKNNVKPITIKNLDILLSQINILLNAKKDAEKIKTDLLNRYRRVYFSLKHSNNIENLWYKLTKDLFLRSESAYFRRIYINTVTVNLLKSILLNYISEYEYNNLLSGTNNLAHTRILDEEWKISRKIRKRREDIAIWQQSVEEIEQKYLNRELPQLTEFVKKFGYRSEKDLDVTYPSYSEDITPIIRNIQSFITLDDTTLVKNNKNKIKTELKLKKRFSKVKYTIIMKVINYIKELLWWREEMRDISTHFYYLVRQCTIKYSEILKNENIIDDINDVWMLKINDLWDYIDGKITKEELKIKINNNKRYYLSYRNFKNDDEIGNIVQYKKTRNYDLKGIGVSSGIVTGPARIVNSESDLNRIKKGDILIARYTDTGWVSKYPLLAGIVTEYGGVLCHIATISRELELPTIVCCEDATKLIKEGQIITINSFDGTIILDNKENML